jgi:hypothetical protein
MPERIILRYLGLYYALTAIWPLIDMNSFELITGKKTDHWLVKTVSIMILGSAIVFLISGWQNEGSTEVIKLLATMNTVGLFLIDIIYVTKKRIRRVYLVDAVIELLFLMLLWL